MPENMSASLYIGEGAPALPKALIVGGPDVDARIELMQRLSRNFRVAAAGTSRSISESFVRAGFEYETYPMARRMNPVADARTLASLIRLFRRHHPDLVHTFDSKPCVYGRLAARLAGVPVVIGTLPGLGSLYSDRGAATTAARAIYERLQQLACRCSDVTIFQNRDDLEQMVSRGVVHRDRAELIPGSGVNTSMFDRASVSQEERHDTRRELGIPLDAVLVTMVSRLIRAKGLLEFAEASIRVRKLHPGTAFLLVGPEDKDSLDRLTADEMRRVGQAVTCAGERGDIQAILAASDIFVLPSYLREGVPRVLLEAASSALPIVTTDMPGCSDVVEDGVNGFLIPKRDVDALCEAVVRLVENPVLRERLGRASRQRAVAHFDSTSITEQVCEVYQKLLEQKGFPQPYRNGESILH